MVKKKPQQRFIVTCPNVNGGETTYCLGDGVDPNNPDHAHKVPFKMKKSGSPARCGVQEFGWDNCSANLRYKHAERYHEHMGLAVPKEKSKKKKQKKGQLRRRRCSGSGSGSGSPSAQQKKDRQAEDRKMRMERRRGSGGGGGGGDGAGGVAGGAEAQLQEEEAEKRQLLRVERRRQRKEEEEEEESRSRRLGRCRWGGRPTSIPKAGSCTTTTSTTGRRRGSGRRPPLRRLPWAVFPVHLAVHSVAPLLVVTAVERIRPVVRRPPSLRRRPGPPTRCPSTNPSTAPSSRPT
mmetsp:Transcript_29241/g.85037  ORF Transcript_29241/g.85037 Transcript_29241/m.85037 type:complete len:292 (-) Transcript_29241:775-1650(-)